MPNEVATLLDDAIQKLAEAIQCTVHPTARVLTITGFDTDDIRLSVAIHIAGQIVNAVQSDLQIVSDFLPRHDDDWLYVERDVERLLDPHGTKGEQFVVTRRNPWLAEAMAHVILHLSKSGVDLGLPGTIWAVTPVTPNVTRQGLDLVALFEDSDGPGYYVAEVKASEDNLNSHTASIRELYRQVLDGRRALELRTHVQALAPFIPPEYRPALGNMLWSKVPFFSPILNHDKSVQFDAVGQSQSVRRHFEATYNSVLMKVVPLQGYADFFNDLTRAVLVAVDQFRKHADV